MFCVACENENLCLVLVTGLFAGLSSVSLGFYVMHLYFRQQSNNGQPYSYKQFLDLAKIILSTNANYAPFAVAKGTIDYFAKAFQYSLDYPLFQVGHYFHLLVLYF